MIKKKLINKINNQIECDLSFEELMNSAKEKEIHIKKFNYKPILISACSILLVSSVIVILESDLLKHPMSGTVEIILPKKIELFGNEYYSTDELIDYEDYSFNLVGYIIEEDDVDSYINEFPNIDYYVVEEVNTTDFDHRVPIYSIENYDYNKYLAVGVNISVSNLYKTIDAEYIEL